MEVFISHIQTCRSTGEIESFSTNSVEHEHKFYKVQPVIVLYSICMVNVGLMYHEKTNYGFSINPDIPHSPDF